MQDSVALERTAGSALQLMADVVYSPSFLDFRPSLVAAGVLTSSRKAAGVWPFWPSSLAQLTGEHIILHPLSKESPLAHLCTCMIVT